MYLTHVTRVLLEIIIQYRIVVCSWAIKYRSRQGVSESANERDGRLRILAVFSCSVLRTCINSNT